MMNHTDHTQSAVSTDSLDTFNNNTHTADSLNRHITNGGVVQITTYGRSIVYEGRSDWFKQGADSNLYVRRGRSWDCLTCSKGTFLMVGLRKGHYKEL